MRRAITKAPKADAETNSKRRAQQKREDDRKRARTNAAIKEQARKIEHEHEKAVEQAAVEQADAAVLNSLNLAAAHAASLNNTAAAVAIALHERTPPVVSVATRLVGSRLHVELHVQRPPVAVYMTFKSGQSYNDDAARLMHHRVPMDNYYARSRTFPLLDCMGVYFLDGYDNGCSAYRRAPGILLAGESLKPWKAEMWVSGIPTANGYQRWPLVDAVCGRGYKGRDPHLTYANQGAGYGWHLQVGQGYEFDVCYVKDTCISPNLSRAIWCVADSPGGSIEPSIECRALTASEAASVAQRHFENDAVWRLNGHAVRRVEPRQLEWRSLVLYSAGISVASAASSSSSASVDPTFAEEHDGASASEGSGKCEGESAGAGDSKVLAESDSDDGSWPSDSDFPLGF